LNKKSIIQELRKQLQNKLPGSEAQYKMAPELRDIRLHNEVKTNKLKKSGVLILLYYKENKLYVCLIKRPEYNGHHSGQVSFPGGKFEKKDKNLIHTALREAHEEIGINPESVTIIGVLSQLKIPVSQMIVYPVIGIAKEKPVFKIDSFEVKYLIETEINDFLNPDNLKTMIININGRNISAPYYAVKNEKIWGATAMILSEFLEIFKKIN